MVWAKDCKLPPTKAIEFKGKPCNTLELLWNVFDSTYNSAHNRKINPSILNCLDSIPTQSWMPFTLPKIHEALKGCTNSSAPGVDHIS
ncbi:hypothetical protein AN958_05129 [Leucoagaricus sp. SymC.cos]|nr:hypothetical protein AN958_05129 [Leucoagaricus sp. SymC.cos]